MFCYKKQLRPPEGSLAPGYVGVRPKLTGTDEPAADFRIDADTRSAQAMLVHLFAIESSGLTACLAIAETVRTDRRGRLNRIRIFVAAAADGVAASTLGKRGSASALKRPVVRERESQRFSPDEGNIQRDRPSWSRYVVPR